MIQLLEFEDKDFKTVMFSDVKETVLKLMKRQEILVEKEKP